MHAEGLCGQARQQGWRISSGQKWVSMRFWKWVCLASAVLVCAVLLAGKDDMIRYGRMRRM
jgi:anti-sigma-K factor RskA